jgi:hypothetical protein
MVEPESEFPIGYYEDFLKEVVRRGIKVITYDDLFEGVEDYDHENNFPEEYVGWLNSRDKDSTYLLIQHDIDNHPEFTKRMVELEARYGLRSNVFMFVDRATVNGTDSQYRIDHDFFSRMQSRGYVMGYHQNALSLTSSSLQDADRRFTDDVHQLRKKYRIDFMVPHGGRSVVIEGQPKHNHDIHIPNELKASLRWVYNKHGVRFAKRWSDGGLRKSRDQERLARADIIGGFLNQLEVGTRNFCLVHPQRWGVNVNRNLNPMLGEQRWYREIIDRHAERRYE